MSTDYRLSLTSSDGSTTDITIQDSWNPLPGSDTWVAADSSQWAVKGGAVSSWGTADTYLTGPVGAQSIILSGFSKGTEAGASVLHGPAGWTQSPQP